MPNYGRGHRPCVKKAHAHKGTLQHYIVDRCDFIRERVPVHVCVCVDSTLHACTWLCACVPNYGRGHRPCVKKAHAHKGTLQHYIVDRCVFIRERVPVHVCVCVDSTLHACTWLCACVSHTLESVSNLLTNSSLS